MLIYAKIIKTSLIVGLIILLVLIIFIITSIKLSKTKKKEDQKRILIIRKQIKEYIYKSEQIKNMNFIIKHLFKNKGFNNDKKNFYNVIVVFKEPKTDKKIITKAYEIEGRTEKISFLNI